MTSLNSDPNAPAIRQARDELDAAIEQFAPDQAESLRLLEAAIEKLHAALKSADNWSEDGTEARNFSLWRAQFLGSFLDDIELAKPDPTQQEDHELN